MFAGLHFLTLWNHLNYYGLGINTDIQSAVLQQHYKRVAESWNGLSQITYLNFLLRTFNTRHRQGGDALNIRTASPSSSSSLVKTEGRVHGDSSLQLGGGNPKQHFHLPVLGLQCVLVLSNPRVCLEHVPPHKSDYSGTIILLCWKNRKHSERRWKVKSWRKKTELAKWRQSMITDKSIIQLSAMDSPHSARYF